MVAFLVLLLISSDTLYLTPEKAVKLALQGNSQIVEASYQLEMARIKVKRSLFQLVPIGSFSGSYSKYREDGDSYTSKSYTLNFEQNIFDPTNLLSYLSSKKELDIEQLALNSLRGDVEVGALKYYYAVVSAQEKVNYLRENLKYSKKQFEFVKERRSLGMATETDLLRANINLLEAKNSLKQAEIRVEKAKRDLKQFLGIPLDRPIFIDAKGIPYINMKLTITDSLKKAVVSAQEDLKIQLLKVEETKWSYRNTIMSFLPRISLGYKRDYSETTPSAFSQGDNTHDVTGLYISLYFEFNSYPFNVKLQKKSLELQKYYVKKTVYTILKNIEDTHDNWKTSLENLKVARENLKLSRKLYEVSKEKFKVGEISSLEFFDSELKLKQAQLNFIEAKYQYFIALITLKSLLGMEVLK